MHSGLPPPALCILLLAATTTAGVAAGADNVTTNNAVNYTRDNVVPTDMAPGTVVNLAKGPTGVMQSLQATNLNTTIIGGNVSAAAATKQPLMNNSVTLHRPRYAQHSAGVYSSHLQHLDDEDDYIDDDDEDEGANTGGRGNGAFSGHKKNLTGKWIIWIQRVRGRAVQNRRF